MLILKQSTAVDIIIGPFVDSTDGDTEETGLTIANTDVLLSKNGQTMAAKNDATTCAHDANGMYNCELDATDTNTVGNIIVFVHVAGALAARHEMQVVEEAVYDDLFAGSAAGYAGISELATVDTVVDGIQTDLDNGTDGLGAIKADTAAILIDTADIQPNYATATALATVDTVVDGIQTDLSNGTDGLGAIKADTAAILVDTADIQPNYATSAALATVDTNVDSILVDTAEIGAAGAGLTALATAANLATVDGVVDSILVDTGTTLPATLSTIDTVVDSILVDTAEIGTAGAGLTAILTTQMTEAYAADGVAPTLAQAIFLIQQTIGDFAIAGTTITTKKLDGSTTAATYTLDDGTSPTSRTRAT